MNFTVPQIAKMIDHSILRPEFTLEDVYAFERRLEAAYPDNRNVRPKIRQQLQVLRDAGFLTFEGRGRYRLAGRVRRASCRTGWSARRWRSRWRAR